MNAIDEINKHFNTNFTRRDIYKLQDVAEKYYKFMKDGGGDDLYKYFEDNVITVFINGKWDEGVNI